MDDNQLENNENGNTSLSQSAQKVQNTLHDLGVASQVVELPGSTRTAQEAATAVRCDVAQIVKSLVFMGKESRSVYLILASGINRVDEKLVSKSIGEKITKADAEYVREKTGFAIGGIPPVGHREKILTLIDQDLLNYQELWAAAGTPHAVFKLSPKELVEISQGDVISIHKSV